MIFDGSVQGSAALIDALDRLKQQGSVLLVVGELSRGSHQLACQHLMGDQSMHRHRLFVSSDGTSSVQQSAISDSSHHRDYIIDYLTDTDAEVECPLSSPDPAGVPHSTATCPSTLIGEVVRTLREIERAAQPFTAGEVRVCVDSLETLIETYGRQTALRLVRYVTEAAQRRTGIIHLHLPVDRDDPLTRLFEPLSDAVIELRAADTQPQQRWHLMNEGIQSDWTSVAVK
ncbi:DUF7504 family protein [Halocatena halophila]|uniref:DUF7504 family protein n=1 Tax=Halocatena halophila TaxID=2814576 RepID=UPI002ED44C31